MTRLDPDWQMTWAFMVAVTWLGLLMKGLAVLRMRAEHKPLRQFFYAAGVSHLVRALPARRGGSQGCAGSGAAAGGTRC